MRLTKIKIAGFKSFADPTTILLPSNLIGVVGPNGCGKSNIIDAVRWVMGESSAKYLRGESMADVIFNGSTSRKPVGQASIELVFDNSDATLGGQYAQYGEVSVRRLVTRDGQSSYYLNGTRCRRRDITDIFLGTGLGPRSYSIIEQGTISRIIEARPEELRIFFEEAAGISKYKERRRETENRIRHTRENLDRLNDLREELDKQLAHLQRQAHTAERFKALKQEERLVRAQLQALRWQSLNRHAGELETRIREHETGYEAAVARQRAIEAETETHRDLHAEATEVFNTAQSRFYSVGADIARLEQSIQHTRERCQQQQQDLTLLDRTSGEAREHLENEHRRVDVLEAELQDNEPALGVAQETERVSAAAQADAEQTMQDGQLHWDEFNAQASEPARVAEVERTRIGQLEQQILQLQQRLERMQEELSAQSTVQIEAEIADISVHAMQAEAGVEEAQTRLDELQSRIAAQRDHNHRASSRLDEARSRLQALRGRQAALEALQQAALGKRDGAVQQWLERRQLDAHPRLAEGLEVEQGWERAVECVLGANLEAVCIDGMDPVTELLGELAAGSLTLFDTTGKTASPAAASVDAGLLDKVRAPWALDSLLSGVSVAETLNEALMRRTHLAGRDSIITRDGIWMGRDWLRVVRDQDERSGVIAREQERKQLDESLATLSEETGTLQAQLEHGREALSALEAEREEAQAASNRANQARVGLRADLSTRQMRLEQVQSRCTQLEAELEEARVQIGADNEEVIMARGRLHEAIERMASLDRQRETLTQQRSALRERLDTVRTQARTARDAAHALALKTGTLRTELNATRQGLERAQHQLDQLDERRETLRVALAESDDPIKAMGQELEEHLSRRMQVEVELAAARGRLEDIDQRLRELDSERVEAEEQVLRIRGELEQVRMSGQELKVRRQTLQEQIAESGFEIESLLEAMPEGAEEAGWSEQVEALERRIQRLGPINLAAIDEYEQQSQRKQYLDAQYTDLTDALATLENAMRKIDRETRTRFKETYDRVNAGMQAMFPRLFGGGHAYLELTGDDLLETGVTVMARPPGKRNSSIHLLSGGEKALTAVALVFAIFELNPAPFCILDEVDAPLDDSNVGHVCRLIKAMSDRTQFILITHNKVTMEIAEHLIGVTMHEPGVSRLVAVDVEEAAALAAM